MSELDADAKAVALRDTGCSARVVEVTPGQDYRVQIRDGLSWWSDFERATAVELTPGVGGGGGKPAATVAHPEADSVSPPRAVVAVRPHEETWTVDVSGEAYCGAIVTTHGGAGVFAVSPCSPSDDWNESDDADAARARLAAQAPAMARMLLSLARHVAPGSLAATCGHEEHDALQALLRAAGVIE